MSTHPEIDVVIIGGNVFVEVNSHRFSYFELTPEQSVELAKSLLSASVKLLDMTKH